VTSVVKKAELSAAYDERLETYTRATETLKTTLRRLLDDLATKHGLKPGMVTGEPKKFVEFHKKAVRIKCATVDACFEEIGDLARARVTCVTLGDCYRMLTLLREQEILVVHEDSIDDMIKTPTETGYRAIHLDVGVDTQVEEATVAIKCELQIRSQLESAWGEFTHEDVYKDSPPELLAALMSQLSDLLHVADRQADLVTSEIAKDKGAKEAKKVGARKAQAKATVRGKAVKARPSRKTSGSTKK
jgi:ppGpp synthetase/RelA/SpoT-type nucleotidyltranferase